MNNTSNTHSLFFKISRFWIKNKLPIRKKTKNKTKTNVPLVFEGIYYHTQPFSITLTAIYSTDPHGPIKTGALAEQGSRKKFSILLVSLRNLKFLRYSPFPWPCISKYGAQAGLALDGLSFTEAIHHFLSYKILLNRQTKKLKARNYIPKQQKCRQPVLMEPVITSHAWREKGPCYPLLMGLCWLH